MKSTLGDVCIAIRMGWLDAAQEMLSHLEDVYVGEAARLNLLGAIYENRGQMRRCRRYYHEALRVNPDYPAARQNLRRLYELHALGDSRLTIALGDERPALMRLLRQRDGQSPGDSSAG